MFVDSTAYDSLFPCEQLTSSAIPPRTYAALCSAPGRLIGLTGRSGAGKDEVAKYLMEHHGYVWFAFADRIKAGLNQMFGWCAADWDDRAWRAIPNKAVGGKTPREVVISLGTEWGRDGVDDEVWIRPLFNLIETCPPSAKGIVVSDVRFNNEASAVVGLGGAVWHLSRSKVVPIHHKSEQGINPIWVDSYINNDGTVEELHGTVDYLLTDES